MSDEGTTENVCASMSAICPSSGRLATRSAAPSRGVTPASRPTGRADETEEIVPPQETMRTRGRLPSVTALAPAGTPGPMETPYVAAAGPHGDACFASRRRRHGDTAGAVRFAGNAAGRP